MIESHFLVLDPGWSAFPISVPVTRNTTVRGQSSSCTTPFGVRSWETDRKGICTGRRAASACERHRYCWQSGRMQPGPCKISPNSKHGQCKQRGHVVCLTNAISHSSLKASTKWVHLISKGRGRQERVGNWCLNLLVSLIGRVTKHVQRSCKLNNSILFSSQMFRPVRPSSGRPANNSYRKYLRSRHT
jgi:hypothetical protein